MDVLIGPSEVPHPHAKKLVAIFVLQEAAKIENQYRDAPVGVTIAGETPKSGQMLSDAVILPEILKGAGARRGRKSAKYDISRGSETMESGIVSMVAVKEGLICDQLVPSAVAAAGISHRDDGTADPNSPEPVDIHKQLHALAVEMADLCIMCGHGEASGVCDPDSYARAASAKKRHSLTSSCSSSSSSGFVSTTAPAATSMTVTGVPADASAAVGASGESEIVAAAVASSAVTGKARGGRTSKTGPVQQVQQVHRDRDIECGVSGFLIRCTSCRKVCHSYCMPWHMMERGFANAEAEAVQNLFRSLAQEEWKCWHCITCEGGCGMSLFDRPLISWSAHRIDPVAPEKQQLLCGECLIRFKRKQEYCPICYKLYPNEEKLDAAATKEKCAADAAVLDLKEINNLLADTRSDGKPQSSQIMGAAGGSAAAGKSKKKKGGRPSNFKRKIENSSGNVANGRTKGDDIHDGADKSDGLLTSGEMKVVCEVVDDHPEGGSDYAVAARERKLRGDTDVTGVSADTDGDEKQALDADSSTATKSLSGGEAGGEDYALALAGGTETGGIEAALTAQATPRGSPANTPGLGSLRLPGAADSITGDNDSFAQLVASPSFMSYQNSAGESMVRLHSNLMLNHWSDVEPLA